MTPARFRPLRLAAPLGFFVAFVAIWETLVRALRLPKIILPSPGDVLQAAVRGGGEWWDAMLATGIEIALAYAASIVLGLALAILFSQASWVRLGLYPYALFLKTLPIVAIAPVIVLWIGQGFWAVVVVAWIVAFLPILTNTTDGLVAIPTSLRNVMRLYGASRFQTLWKLQLPHALPYLVAGCKISSVSCVLGAVVGEMAVGTGARMGLGNWILAKKDVDVPGMFVYILSSGLVGVVLFAVTSIVGDRVLLYWRDPVGDER